MWRILINKNFNELFDIYVFTDTMELPSVNTKKVEFILKFGFFRIVKRLSFSQFTKIGPHLTKYQTKCSTTLSCSKITKPWY